MTTVQAISTLKTRSGACLWVSLGDLIAETRNGLYKPDTFYGRGTPILKMYNIGRLDGKWVLERLDQIELTNTELQTYALAPGDILLNRVNSRELVGKCAVVDERTAGFVFESKNMRVRLRRDLAEPEFVVRFLNSRGGRSQIEDALKQIVGQATVSRPDLDAIRIPLPPLAEQRRIAARLSEQMSHVARARAAAEERLHAAQQLPVACIRSLFGGITPLGSV